MPPTAPTSAWLERIRSGAIGRAHERYFVAYRADEPVAGTFRARQMQAVLRLAPLTMLANGINVALIVGAFWGVSNNHFLLLWALAIAFLVWRGMRVWWHTRRRDPRTSASPRAMRRATLHASLLASLWAMVPMVLFAGAGPTHQLLVAVVTTGMMCAGGFALATAPVAGTVYMLILGAGAAAILVLANFPLARVVGTLVVIYAYIMVASV